MRYSIFPTFSFSLFPLPPSLFAALLTLSLFPPLVLSLSGCANPVAPTGGPRDTTPPEVVRSEPEDGAVNVDRESVHLVFSEHIDRASFEQAVSVTPAFEGNIDIDFGGQEATVHFPEPLRENTTYILTLDKDLQDTRSVALDAPITIAFATGPTINRGQLAGRVIGAEAGEPQEGFDIYAYGLSDSTAGEPTPPDSLPDRPDYRTQTNSEGQFQFEYLQEQAYFVIALEDANRNRQPDPIEAYAVPPRPVLVADSTGADTDGLPDWIATLHDTTSPTPARVQPQSRGRHVLRFDEPVRLLDRSPAPWSLYDSLRDRSMQIERVYQRAASPDLVFLDTEPLDAAPHRLYVPDSTVADSIGNVVSPDTLRFTPSETPDTLRTRFVTFTPEALSPDTADVYTLLPGEAIGVRFNQPLDSTRLHDVVAARDTGAGADRPFTLATRDGTTYRLRFDPSLRPDDHVEVRVDGQPLSQPDTVFARTFARISNRALGELSGTVVFADTADAGSTATPPFVVELYADGGPGARRTPRRTLTDEEGRFLFDRLPEGSFRFRAFLDRNENGRWDGGQFLPFRAAEPITWSEGTIDTRPRWENELETPLRLPSP